MLISTTAELLLWVGRDAGQPLLKDVFDVNSIVELQSGIVCQPAIIKHARCLLQTVLPRLENAQSRKVRIVIDGLRSVHHLYMPLVVVKEDSPLRSNFLQLMVGADVYLLRVPMPLQVDDRTESALSYYEFVSSIQVMLQPKH